MKLFSIYDVKAKFFLKIFTDSSSIAALRSFDAGVNETESVFSKFPDDFALMELADFDPNSGELTPLTHPVNLGSARTVLRDKPQQMSLKQ